MALFILRWLSFSLCIISLSACDLDKSESSNSTDITLSEQKLQFDDAGPIFLKIGSSLDNPATGLGEGDISYQSSNESVAEVDAHGRVTILKLGHTQITAKIEADKNYESASQVYEIKTVFSVTAWIGENDTQLKFSDGTQGMEFYRSTDFSCDFTQYNACENGAMDILNGNTIFDTTTTLSQKAFYQFNSDQLPANVEASIERFSARRFHQTVKFMGKLWLIAGSDEFSNSAKNDVWSSSDGIYWTEETSNAAFKARSQHQVVVFKDKLWLIGGLGRTYEKLNDVWSSSDGITWIEETANAPFTARRGHQVEVFNGKLWLIGGNTISDIIIDPYQVNYPGLNDVWSSSDGIDWTEETRSASFSPRYNHQIKEFNSKLWLVGGVNQLSDHKDDVWSSSDGINWLKDDVNGGIVKRSLHQMTVHDGKLILLGGRGNVSYPTTEVTFTSDGVNWISETPVGDFQSFYRLGHQLTSFNEKLVLTGGYAGGNVFKNDVWFSTNGINWYEQTAATPYSRFRHQVKVFKDKMWIIGGYTERAKNDIWSSVDGISWKNESNSAEFGARTKHKIEVFNEKLWLVGGRRNGLDENSDVWVSDDAVTWNEVTPEDFTLNTFEHDVVEFNSKLFVMGNSIWSLAANNSWKKNLSPAPSFFSQYVEFKGKLWSLGGSSRFEEHNKIFSSANGEDWIEENSGSKFSARSRHQVVVWNEKIWVVGGRGIDGHFYNDIWSSDDGISWEEVLSDAPFNGVYDHQVVVFKGKIFIVGGFDSNRLMSNFVWSSTDGLNWRKGIKTEIGLLNQR